MIAHFMGPFYLWSLREIPEGEPKGWCWAVWGVCLVGYHYPSFLLPSLFLVGGGIDYQWILQRLCGGSLGVFPESPLHPRMSALKPALMFLIYSNLLMIAMNVVRHESLTLFRVSLAILCLVLGMVFIGMLPGEQEDGRRKNLETKPLAVLKTPLLLLVSFCLYNHN